MLSLGLNLLGIGKHLLGWVSGAFKWLFAKWYRVALLVALAAFLWAYTGWTFADRRADKEAARAEKNEKKYKAEAAAHIGTKVAYKNAQAIAADMNRKQVAAIKERYDAITTETENEYEKRLADNRAALRQWMRTKAAPSIAQASGTGSSTEMPAQVVPRAEEALVPVADLEIAADNYSQLVSLIEWAKKVGEVKP